MNTIEFISYTGKYPNLCRGILTVKINGREYKFGHDFSYYNYKENRYDNEDLNNPNFDEFWATGGLINIKNTNYIYMSVEKHPWVLNSVYDKVDENHPQWIKDVLPQLLNVFNENVNYGCCGGCI